ncbi:GNAT family N-acetyltransferase [Sedimenticola selenatireducens]|uniref:GNAT family N-acetyltransferase n=1 Tax=Sedimenticola selenatireducens TaxID=191960 RepID=A0A2N6D1U0_9GAMM|nr:GNAT family N-acetyltransferase [Sedimenticola selenatireducens]PLX63643.1 MAG: GNAT family N-acetyltransferase [Sedimenticola selenatireducens]
MPTQDFTVSQAHWPESKTILRAIRESVFIIEQQVPKALEWDDQDESALHAIATDSEGNGIGTGRVTGSGQIGRMAVLSDWRNRGVGSALLAQLIELARNHELKALFLNAQKQAIPFYLRHGFHPVGEVFMEAGIPHQRMERDERQLNVRQESP